MKLQHFVIALMLVLVPLAGVAQEVDFGFDVDSQLGVTWMGLYLNEQKSGYMRNELSQIMHNDELCYELKLTSHINLKVMGAVQVIDTVVTHLFNASGEWIGGTSTGMGEFEVTVKDDQMLLTSRSGGAERTRTIQNPGIVMKEVFPEVVLLNDRPEVGSSTKSRTFEFALGRPLLGTTTVKSIETVMHEGDETTVYNMQTVLAEMNMTTTSKITEGGFVLEMRVPIGLMEMVMRQETEEQAKDQEFQGFEALDMSTVKVTGKMPNVERTRVIRLRLEMDDDAMPKVDDERQRWQQLEDGSWLLTLRRDSRPARIATIPLEGEEFAEHLEATDEFQSDHPDIIRTARRIIGDETNAIEAATKLSDWVYENVRKQGTAAYSNALETLQTMEGDCTEHTALYVALCRAVGLPARDISGIVYAPQIGGFGGHAWAEVYVGSWIAVDPTFGELPANPARIKTGGGCLVDTMLMAQGIKDLKIHVVEEPARDPAPVAED